jgi:hypothetical protein
MKYFSDFSISYQRVSLRTARGPSGSGLRLPQELFDL